MKKASFTAHVVKRIAARRGRDQERARRTGQAVRAGGGSAMDAALAAISAGFDEAAAITSFQLRVLNYIRLGTGHPAVRARYGARVEMIRQRTAAWTQANSLAAGPLGFSPHPDTTLTIAINLVEGWYRNERKAFQFASVFGCGNRLSLEVLRELRLILRLIRASEYRDHFPAILDEIHEFELFVEAEAVSTIGD
jgi:hypothetical protein